MGEPRWPTVVRYFACRFGKRDKKCHPKRVSNPYRCKKVKFRKVAASYKPKSVPVSESVAGSASTSDNDSEKKKKRVVEDLWLAEI